MEEDYIMFVYKTTNTITGLIYIGQHIYKKEIKKPKLYLGSGTLLKESIKKHGRQNHEREILDYCDNFKELNEREIYWISKFDSTNEDIGMNISAGGRQCLPSERYRLSMTSPERLEKFYATRKKNEHTHKYHTEEYKKQCSENMKGEDNPNYGNKWSDEQKEHLSSYRKEHGTFAGENNPNYGKYGKDASGYLEIDENNKKEIIEDYTQNFFSIRSLSRKYVDISEYKIKELLLEENLEIKQLYISKETEEKIIDMYCNQNLSTNKISKKLNLESRNIKKVLDNNNTPKNNPTYIPIPDDIKKKLLYDFEYKFMRVARLGEKYSLNITKIRLFLQEKGFDTKTLFISKNIQKTIIDMYVIKNKTITHISKYFGLDVRHVRKLLREKNLISQK